MRHSGDGLILSATDLTQFLCCRYGTALEMAVAFGVRTRPHWYDPLLEILWQRGREHEERYVESLRTQGKSVVDLSAVRGYDEAIARTIEALRSGADVVSQGALGDGRWFGKPDVLQKVDKASALGPWSYEVADTKLARETAAGTVLQLGVYGELLKSVQGTRPDRFHVVTPDPEDPLRSYRTDDYAAYVRLIRGQMEAAVAGHDFTALAASSYPEPVDRCDVCAWSAECSAKRHADDHLSIVAGITALQRRELESREVGTLTALARLEVPLPFKPRRGSKETYERVREQARVQLEARQEGRPVFDRRPVEAGTGLTRLPEPSPGDVFLDLEGDSFAREGGPEYLFGVVTLDGDGAPVYQAFWAYTDAEERAAFEKAVDLIASAWQAHDGMHVYHFAPYEPSAFKRLMGRYATREDELDRLLRGHRFVDLYGVVRQGLWAGVERYSIKNLEPFYGFERTVPLPDASRALRAMEQALESYCPELVPPEMRERVEGYNRDDCVSTLRLRDWLEGLRQEVIDSGTEVPRPTLEAGAPSEKIDERAQRVETLRARLLDGVPVDRALRGPEQQARWLLAYLLDWHRREDKAVWWEYYRLIELPEEDLFDEAEALAGLEYVRRVDVVRNTKTGKPTGSVVDRYRFPVQEMEVRPGHKLKLQDETSWGEVVGVDRTALTVDVKKGPKQAEHHPSSAFAFTFVNPGVMEEAIYRLAGAVADGGTVRADGRAENAAAHRLLLAATPKLREGEFAAAHGESAVELAVRIASELDATVLPIQGPPGSGKTFCGAGMICALVAAGKKVGVTATSHKVIRNLLEAVAGAAAKKGLVVRLAHKSDGEEADGPGQSVVGVSGLDGSGLVVVDVEHAGNRNASDEEASVVAGLVARLLAPGAQWTDEEGVAVRAAVPQPAADAAGERPLPVPGARAGRGGLIQSGIEGRCSKAMRPCSGGSAIGLGHNGVVETATGVSRDEVVRILAGFRPVLTSFRVKALFVFGSVARGDATSQSDIDLLVDFEEAPTLFEFARLRRALSEQLGHRVDLVSRTALKPQLRERILSEAVRAA